MKKSKYNLSHSYLMSGDFGWLYPVVMEDCLPGDVFTCRSELYIKAIPLLAPIMDKVDVRLDYFFVPNRLLWEGWTKFITGGSSGTNEQVSPWFTFNPAEIYGTEYENQVDFYGADIRAVVDKVYQLAFKDDALVQSGAPTNTRVRLSCLPALAVYKIVSDWYNPENIWAPNQDPDEQIWLTNDMVSTDGHVNDAGRLHMAVALKLFQRAYSKDRFTTCNQAPQRGPEVGFDIPPSDIVAGSATGPNGTYVISGTTTLAPNSSVDVNNGSLRSRDGGGNYSDIVHTHSQNYEQGELGTLTINELRRLSALQRWFEKNARFGARYIEQILSHFGVRTPDYRLDRSEYLGGTVSPITVSETYQTAAGEATQETEDVLGQYAGHLSGYSVNGMRKYRCDEHGWIVGLLSLVPKMSYAQGIQRRFMRLDRLDYAFPEFANLGEEAVYKREVFVTAGSNYTSEPVFGYTPRYSSYRHRENRFDSNFLNTFPFWHLGQIYNQQGVPVLDADFMFARNQDGASQFDRIFAYTPIPQDQSYNFGQFHFLCQLQHHLFVKRPIPKYVNPHLL